MVSAVGSSTASSAAHTAGASTAGIEAQIVRYKKELSDCVNCASSKTPEGKAAIQAITIKISSAHARIEKINADKPASQPAASSTATANKTPANTYAAASSGESKASVESASAPTSSSSTTGSLVDVFA
jgi:hypothetical protein